MADRLAEPGLFLLTLLGWGLLLYVILALPASASGAQALFYGAGFVALTGSAAFISALYRSRSRRSGGPLRARNTLAMGMRFAIAVEFALWLQSFRLLTAPYLVFIIAGFLLLEMLFRYAGDDRRGYRE